jgi:hypothetical protein
MWYYPKDRIVFSMHEEIRRHFLWVMFPSAITDDDLAFVEVHPLVYSPPVLNAGQMHEPGDILQIEGQWVQSWAVREAKLEELAAMKPPVPQEVTMRQARLALLGINKLEHVAPTIESLNGADRDIARIEWEFSSTVVRGRPLVTMLGQALGLDEDALDQLFITAAEL